MRVNHKKRSNNKKKNADYMRRAKVGLKGLILTWHDCNPLIEMHRYVEEVKVTHKNPTQKLICQEMWNTCRKFIVETEFTWQVKVDVVFKSNRHGEDKIDVGIFTHTCGIRGINNEKLDRAIESFIIESRLNNSLVGESQGFDHKSYGEFERVNFTAEIIGI